MLCGRHGEAAGGPPHFIYAAFNMYYKPLPFGLPVLPRGMTWYRFADTGMPSPRDIAKPGEEHRLALQKHYTAKEWSSFVLVGK